MKADLRISAKDSRRNKNLKIQLMRVPCPLTQLRLRRKSGYAGPNLKPRRRWSFFKKCVAADVSRRKLNEEERYGAN
jgi:hypothetical protein